MTFSAAQIAMLINGTTEGDASVQVASFGKIEEAQAGQLAFLTAVGLNYNIKRLHESLNNLAPADVYFGRRHAILEERERIKTLIIQNRRLQHQLKAA